MFPAGGGGGGGGSAYFVQNQQQLFHALDGNGMEDAAAFTAGTGGGGGELAAVSVSDTHCHALLYNLSVLKDKVQQLEPIVGVAVGHDGHGPVVSVSVSGAGAIIQEIITAASSMMYAFQQLCGLGAPPTSANNAAAQVDGVVVGHDAKNGTADDDGHGTGCSVDQQAMDHVMQQWQQLHHGGHGHSSYYIHSNPMEAASSSQAPGTTTTTTTTDTIIELDAAELLARYTHYCQVCGKGFKRDANLRMHMRAHGDEYKSKAALANPTKPSGGAGAGEDAPAPPDGAAGRSKYSCPQEGCRWNRKHARFQPLKSVICVKNHYKRSHCPKMYVCSRCNRKHFSVLSDLRTHEKHCGDHRWLCSCGTNFSRKDKLAGHVSLFVGHEPAVPLGAAAGSKHGKRPSSSSTSQLGNRATGGFGMP